MPLELREHVLGTNFHAKNQSKMQKHQVLANAAMHMASAGHHDFSRFGFPGVRDPETSVFVPEVEAQVRNAGFCTEAILGVLDAEDESVRQRYAEHRAKLAPRACGFLRLDKDFFTREKQSKTKQHKAAPNWRVVAPMRTLRKPCAGQ